MDWRQGYTASWHLYSVNQSTWGEGDEIDGLVSASVTKDSESALIEDASISVDTNKVNGYVRLILEADNNVSSVRESLGTFLVTTPRRNINGSLVTVNLSSYSVLKPASDKLLLPGWYFPAKGDPVAGACELLRSVLHCPVEMSESDIRTENAIVAENGETYLSIVQYMLADTDYYIHISGRGEVSIKKKSNKPVAEFDTFRNDVLMPTITDETDMFDIPNVVLVTDNYGGHKTIYNEDESSPTSIKMLVGKMDRHSDRRRSDVDRGWYRTTRKII